MDIVIMHETVAQYDAIGNDIEAMFRILSETHDCYVYARNRLNKNVKYIDRDEVFRLIVKPDCVVIYHHSVYWAEGHSILKHVRGKIVFRYHNITPPEFFQEYNAFHFRQCNEGRKQTEQLIQDFKDAFWLSDSKYNTEDLKMVPEDHTGICPPFHRIEEWAKSRPDEAVLKMLLESGTINLLFVGRVAPNKGHMMLLEIVSAFKENYGEKLKLRIIGKFDEGLQGYNSKIENFIVEHDLSNQIEFIGAVNDATLMAYYLGSDMLVCTSQHEGFCVPIAEAQYFGLPVLALRECAVPETLGDNQVLLDGEPRKFAAAVHLISENHEYQQYLAEQGKKNFDARFTYELIDGIFKDICRKEIGITV